MAKLSLQKINGNDSISASRLVINKNFEDISNAINNFENENNVPVDGIILTAPNGDKYKITVDNVGVLETTKIN